MYCKQQILAIFFRSPGTNIINCSKTKKIIILDYLKPSHTLDSVFNRFKIQGALFLSKGTRGVETQFR